MYTRIYLSSNSMLISNTDAELAAQTTCLFGFRRGLKQDVHLCILLCISQ